MEGSVVPNALDATGWGATVRVDEELRKLLLDRQRAGPLEGSVSVTELLEPRPSYWRRVRPVPATPERAARMRAGQEMHIRAGHLLAPATAREVRRRREGIVARIDLLEERVTELKTTSLRGPGSGGSIRPSYLQQLAVYCGLLERPKARLVLIDPRTDAAPLVEAYDTEFPSPEVAWAEALRRAQQLRSAFEHQTPAELPRCPWRDRGCEFQAAGVCDCTGAEPEASPDAFGTLPPVEPAPRVALQLSEALRAPTSGPTARRFRDLLYPRRARRGRGSGPRRRRAGPRTSGAPSRTSWRPGSRGRSRRSTPPTGSRWNGSPPWRVVRSS